MGDARSKKNTMEGPKFFSGVGTAQGLLRSEKNREHLQMRHSVGKMVKGV